MGGCLRRMDFKKLGGGDLGKLYYTGASFCICGWGERFLYMRLGPPPVRGVGGLVSGGVVERGGCC